MKHKVTTVLNVLFIILAGAANFSEVYIQNSYLYTAVFLFSNLVYLTGTILWYLSLRHRILNKDILKGFLMIAVCMGGMVFNKVVKYRLAGTVTAERYLDYFYVVLLALAASEFLLITVYLGKPIGYRVPKKIYLVYIPAFLISVLVMTNDLHQWCYLIKDDGHVSLAAGQVAVYVFMTAEVLAAIFITIRKCRVPAFRRKGYIPAVIFAALLSYYVLQFFLQQYIRFPYKFADAALIFVVFFIESFMHVGLIRSNDGYAELFEKSSLNAFVTDRRFNILASGENSHEYTKEELEKCLIGSFIKNDIRLNVMQLKDTLFYYEDSLEKIRSINKKLSDVLVTIDEENEIMEEEQRVSRQNARVRQEMDIYSEITDIILPSVKKAESMLRDIKPEDTDYERKISSVCFIIAYIKRRINLTLLDKVGELTDSELEFALNELLSTYRLHGIEASYNLDKTMDTKGILKYFDYCYGILLDHIDEFDACYIVFGKEFVRINADKEDESLMYGFPSAEGKEL